MTPQPLHIFEKDVRHLWPETLVTLLLVVALAWTIPYGWHHDIYSAFVPLLSGLLHLLLPIAWLVVISRLIQDESLVGDRQFWTSRPYHWASLLAAKVLYLLAFIYLPFFLMQVYLLKHAGLYPTTALPSLLENLLLLTVFLIVPIVAIATVTSTFPRVLLSFIGAILYVLVVAGLYGFFTFQRMPTPHLAGILETLVIVVPLAAIIYQYATRRTGISRALLLGTPLVVVLVLLLTPATAIIRHSYPLAGSGDDVPALTAIPVPANAPLGPGNPFSLRGNVLVNVPFAVKDKDDDSDYTLAGVSAQMTNSPANWTSAYLAAGLPPIIPGPSINSSEPYVVVPVFVPRNVFNAVKTSPVDLHLSLALDHLKAGKPTTWHSSALPFSVPGHGVCFPATEQSDEMDAGRDAGTTCRFAFKTPDLLFATAPVSAGACNTPGAQTVAGRASLSSRTGLLSFDPVAQAPLNLTAGGQGARQSYQLCPGTAISFVEAEAVGKERLEVDSKQVVLDPLAMRIPPRATAGAAPQGGPAPE